MTREPERPPVEVRRSARRRRTVSAYRAEDGTVVVLLPARMSRAEEQQWVEAMVARVQRSESRRRPSDAGLEKRAAQLSERYLEGLARPTSVRWVGNQGQRWGSCTPTDGSIRLSTRLQGLPRWVADYVLLHELAHLLVAGHNAAFWKLLEAYPETARARAFLEGVSYAMARGLKDGGAPDGQGAVPSGPAPSPDETWPGDAD
jgi:predicted metal-dependent hydrolase